MTLEAVFEVVCTAGIGFIVRTLEDIDVVHELSIAKFVEFEILKVDTLLRDLLWRTLSAVARFGERRRRR